MNKSVFSCASFEQNPSDLEFWMMQSPEDRLNAIEFLRQQFYDYNPFTSRLQRILEIADPQ
jgi:hypothetical protein